MREIKICRFKDGFEVISDVEELETGEYRLNKPVSINQMKVGKKDDPTIKEETYQDQMAIGFYPFIPLSDQSFLDVFPNQLFCRPYKPVKELENKYRSVFGSGIIVSNADSNILVPK